MCELLERPGAVTHNRGDVSPDSVFCDMSKFETPIPKDEIRQAGKILRTPAEDTPPEKMNEALDVLNRWRSFHAHPLIAFRMLLTQKSEKVEKDVIVAQRIKRLAAIKLKLSRFKNMQLDQIQDIGGCRAIFSNVNMVEKVRDSYRTSRTKHILKSEKNYIKEPKESGYRGIHLVYSYNSKDKPQYNDVKIEIQLRSQLQHAWATAVEIVDTFTSQSLKSSQGNQDWERFFQLMSAVVARKEGCCYAKNLTGDFDNIIKELKCISKKLEALDKLRMYGTPPSNLQNSIKNGDCFSLLRLNVKNRTIETNNYKNNEFAKANKDYLELEKAVSNDLNEDVVLVSLKDLSMIKRAYPNYFLDTMTFTECLEESLGYNT